MTKPTATGNLTSTPFCELLVYALGQGLGGSLVLECPDRSKHALLFHAGRPVKARVADAGLRLGELLALRGSIGRDALRSAETGAEGELFGQRLIAQGVASAEDVSAALDEQIYAQIAWLSRTPSATAFAYFDGVDLLAKWGGEHRQLDPLAAIWQAVQAGAPEDRLAEACRAFGERTLRLHPASRIGRFGFGSRERPLLDVLRVKPQSFAELKTTGLCDESALERMLYTLALTRHLDTGQFPLGVTMGAAAPAPSTQRRRPPSSVALPAVSVPEPGPAPDFVPEPEPVEAVRRRELKDTGRFASREEIAQKHQRIEGQNHYEVLEIEPAATAAQVATSFAQLARRWHPDRLSPDLADLKDLAMRVFARVTEAHRVISHPSSREEYDRSLGGGASEQDDEQAQVARVLRAAEAFQKAEILLRKRDLDGAERFASLALAGDVEQPEYAALHAWIRARKAGATEADVSSSLTVLQQCVSKQGNNVKIRYYLAGVLKLSGQHSAALREFRFVAENDPSNLDAARELRLNDIRKHQRPESAPSEGGLFGRLFKR